MNLHIYTGGMAETNGYAWEYAEGKAIVIDAPEGMANFLARKKLTATHLLLTHQHFDHVMDAAAILKSGAELYAYAQKSDNLTLIQRVRSWGIPLEIQDYNIENLLENQRMLDIAGIGFQTIHVPGHSPDSLCFYNAENGILFSGDTLMNGGVGRTDLPHGSHDQLISHLKNHILTLPAATKVFSGHGDATNIADEKAWNQFLR